MSTSTEAFQISVEAAEKYESELVPALFADWAPRIVDAGRVVPGHSVLDVACGTGVVARAVADRLGGAGKVVGLDLNEAMLTVARRLRPDIQWDQGDAAELPYAHGSFDVVLCQSGLMFFPDRAQALREMGRVVKVGGRVAVQVWASLESQPAYGPIVEIAARHAGPEAVNLLSSYWVLGDLDLISSLFEAAGLSISASQTHTGSVRFASVDEAVRAEVESTPLRDRISDEVYGRILEDCRAALAQFISKGGGLEVPIRGHVISAVNP